MSEFAPSVITPRTEPTRLDPAHRSIVARWNIGAPAPNGGQRQARFEVQHFAGKGYRAHVTTVIETQGRHGTSEEFTVSLMNLDLVHDVPAARYSQAGMARAYADALDVLRDRFDVAETAIVRHFDDQAPIPSE